jgi:hypothetical protein
MIPALLVCEGRQKLSGTADLALLVFGVVAVYCYYLAAQRVSRRSLARSLLFLPFLSAVGMGISLSNTRAVLSALFGRKSEFQRTPKYDIRSRRDTWRDKRYRATERILPFFEVAFGLYFAFGIALALSHRLYYSLPFLLLFAGGFLYVGLASLGPRPHPRATEPIGTAVP